MTRRRDDENIVPFRRKPRWTRAEDYGRVLPTATWRGEPQHGRGRLARLWSGLRWWLGLIVIAALWVLWRDATALEPPAFLEGDPVRVSGDFTRCGSGRGALCVIDGDTLKLEDRNIRLVGIDAPEVKALCPAEAVAAERATQALQGWLNAAPFELVARLDRPTDKWDRDLMTARRTVAGREQTAAEALLAQGVVRAYAGEARQSWC